MLDALFYPPGSDHIDRKLSLLNLRVRSYLSLSHFTSCVSSWVIVFYITTPIMSIELEPSDLGFKRETWSRLLAAGHTY